MYEVLVLFQITQLIQNSMLELHVPLPVNEVGNKNLGKLLSFQILLVQYFTAVKEFLFSSSFSPSSPSGVSVFLFPWFAISGLSQSDS